MPSTRPRDYNKGGGRVQRKMRDAIRNASGDVSSYDETMKQLNSKNRFPFIVTGVLVLSLAVAVGLSAQSRQEQVHPDAADIAARQTGCFRSCSSPSAASRQERLAIRVPRTTVELHGDRSPLMPEDIEAARR